MSRSHEVERFVREHRGCGTLTPSTSAPIAGRRLLSLSCSCGKRFDRWVDIAEAADAPVTVADASAIDITSVAATSETLEDAMRQALESLDARSRTPAPPPARPSPPPVMPPPVAPVEPAPPAAPSASPVLSEVPGAAAVPPAALSRPLPPRRRPARHRAEGGAPPNRASLEAALRATLDVLNADDAGAAPATARPTRAHAVPGDHPAAEAPAGSSGKRRPPDKHALQDALKATLTALEAERTTGSRGGGRAMPPAAPPAPVRRRRLGVGGAIGISLALAAAVGLGYGLRAIGQRRPDVGPVASRAVPRLPVANNERAAVSQAVAVLREIQALSRPDVRYRFYFDRVAFAKGDVDRHLAGVKDVELRRALDETIGLHVLAANAWRAKTLNERDKWEAIGDDPASELCPEVRRVLSLGDEPATMSRAQWRGHALAAAVPLLWDCAGERLAEVERGLNPR